MVLSRRCFLDGMIVQNREKTNETLVNCVHKSYFYGCSRRCPIFNYLNLGGIIVNSLNINYVPKKLHDTDPEITFGELEDIQCAGSDTRPPMLDWTDFASWQQRIRRYCWGKENGVNILKSIDKGPF
nr:integrase, catalytic region, zinc finger, CCHC-type, peptidase aspartic, catalytic [Tanacetum cinerariifolium]